MTAVNLNNLLLQLYGKICDAASILETRVFPPESPTSPSVSPNKLQHCIVVVDLLKQQIQSIENEYRKLETLLQKQQQDIRKHISVQQQLKLHGQSLQQQLDESEKGRKSLLDETKKMLIQLKRQNQKLFHDNEQLRRDIQELKMKSPRKTENKHHRTNSSKADESARRLKTQYHDKKVEKSPQTSQRKHNLSVESLKGKAKERPSSMRKGSGLPSGYLRTGSKQKSHNLLTTSVQRSSVGKKIHTKKKQKLNKTSKQPKKQRSAHGHFTSKNRHMDSQDKSLGPSSVPFYRSHLRYEI